LGKGPQERDRRISQFERRTMLRRNFVGIVVLSLLCTVVLGAQIKEMPRTPVKPINAPKTVDINTAPESEIIALGISGAVAKKIVDGRPYRSKRDLVTRQVLTEEQYEKYKDSLVARRARNPKK
jgi:competence protein ComEA